MKSGDCLLEPFRMFASYRKFLGQLLIMSLTGILLSCGENFFEEIQKGSGNVMVVYLGGIGDCVPCTAFPTALAMVFQDSSVGKLIKVVGVIQCERKIELEAWAYKEYFDVLLKDDGSLKQYRDDGVRVIVVNEDSDVVGTLTDQDLHENRQPTKLGVLIQQAIQ